MHLSLGRFGVFFVFAPLTLCPFASSTLCRFAPLTLSLRLGHLRFFSLARASFPFFADCDITRQVVGTPEERELASLAISITLQQRDGGKVDVDFSSLEDRDDVSSLDVPVKTVGFLLGAKGTSWRCSLLVCSPTPAAPPPARTLSHTVSPRSTSHRVRQRPAGATLRAMESKHKVFMFFDNERLREGREVRASLYPCVPCASLRAPSSPAMRTFAPRVRLSPFAASRRGKPSGCTSSVAEPTATAPSTRQRTSFASN